VKCGVGESVRDMDIVRDIVKLRFKVVVMESEVVVVVVVVFGDIVV